jgi:predicted nucleotidyltransferase
MKKERTMRIRPGDVIAGQPALAIRKLLQQERGTVATIAEILAVDLATAKQVYEQLVAEGYIKAPDDTRDEGWQTTTRGNALAHASARKPITRKTAERLVAALLDRVSAINACDDYVYRVKQVIVFGSYLTDRSDLGDIDLAITLQFRFDDPGRRERQMQERIEQARRDGRVFRSYFDEITWPHLEIFQMLKGRSPSLSLHSPEMEQELLQSVPTKILFDITQEQR